MRTVSLRLIDLNRVTINLGFAGENEHTRVIIDCKRAFDEYPTAVQSLTVKNPAGSTYPAVTVRDGDLVYWDVTNSDLTAEGAGEIQLAFIVDEVVAKSYIGKTKISRSLMPNGEAPSAIDNWIEEANDTLERMLETVREVASEAVSQATEKAEEASQSAEEASEAKADSQTAQDKAEEAQDKAETAQEKAEESETAAEESASQASQSESNAEAWAVGERAGVHVEPPDETYQNNAKYWAQVAQQGAEDTGYAWFDVLDSDGCMYVTITPDLGQDISFSVNETTGMLEVVH